MQASSLQGIHRRYPHHGTEKVAEFAGHFNNRHTNIKFTIETSEEKQHISYMDVTLHITTRGDISYQVFYKARKSGLLIDFHSAVPGHVKAAVATSQFCQAKQLSSHNIMRKESEANICQQLRLNPYPEVFINEAKNNAKKSSMATLCKFVQCFSDIVLQTRQYPPQNSKRLIRRYNFPVRIVNEHRGSP